MKFVITYSKRVAGLISGISQKLNRLLSIPNQLQNARFMLSMLPPTKRLKTHNRPGCFSLLNVFSASKPGRQKAGLLTYPGYLLLAWISCGFCGKDPISWTMQPASGFPKVGVGEQSKIKIILTSHLPGDGRSRISTDFDAKGGIFHIQDNCQQFLIQQGGQCEVDVAFIPQDNQPHQLQFFYAYHNNLIPLDILTPPLKTPTSLSVKGSIAGVPPSFTLNPLQTPRFVVTYVNDSASSINGYASNTVTITPAGKANANSISNTCGTSGSPIALAPGKSCQQTIELTPLATGKIIISPSFVDTSHSKTTVVNAHSEIKSGSGSCSVQAKVVIPFLSSIFKYSDSLVRYEFENNCATAVKLGNVTIAAKTTPPSATQPIVTTNANFDDCSGKTLAANSRCAVLVSVIPQTSLEKLSLQASVKVNQTSAKAITTTKVVTADNTKHNVRFINHCAFDVWYGIANGNGVDGGITYSPDPTPDSQSANGAKPAAYLIKSHQSGLTPNVKDLSVTEYLNGAIWPRTDCTLSGGEFQCSTGYCKTVSATSATCVERGNAFSQPSTPYTKFEFTIEKEAGKDGVYDTSVINGMTVPVEIKALGPSNDDPFNCNAAGAPIQPVGNQLGNCSWRFTPPASGPITAQDFIWVTQGADDACVNNCADPTEICGMANNQYPPNSSTINRRCGDFLGFSTAANYVGFSAAGQWGSKNLYNDFNVGTLMSVVNPARNYGTIGGVAATFKSLLACTPTSNNSANTCYNDYGNPTQNQQCCGCVNWQNASGSEKTASKACVGQNTDWLSSANVNMPVYDAILWLKQACPTAYSFQFDDPSSSFQCNLGDNNTKLVTSYDITFCPGGLSGLPDGITDGR